MSELQQVHTPAHADPRLKISVESAEPKPYRPQQATSMTFRGECLEFRDLRFRIESFVTQTRCLITAPPSPAAAAATPKSGVQLIEVARQTLARAKQGQGRPLDQNDLGKHCCRREPRIANTTKTGGEVGRTAMATL